MIPQFLNPLVNWTLLSGISFIVKLSSAQLQKQSNPCVSSSSVLPALPLLEPETTQQKMLLHKLVPILFILGGLTHSAPLTCEQLTQPAEQLDPGHLEGTWALIAGSISYLPYLEIFRQRDSASIHFPSNRSLTNFYYSRGLRADNKCVYSTSNITLNGSGFTFDGTPASNSSSVFVRTSCPDCLITRFTVDSGQRTHLYLFSRRRALERDELQEFTEQVRCLQMPPPAVMDPTKDLCPWPEETLKD